MFIRVCKIEGSDKRQNLRGHNNLEIKIKQKKYNVDNIVPKR